MTLPLFPAESFQRPSDTPSPDALRAVLDPAQQARLGQYFTPCWVTESLVAEYFPDLDANDCVLEPACGEGRFLQAIPAHVPAVGVEIDPVVAEAAARITGRRIITGDIRTVTLDLQPTVVLGNPPFAMDVVDAILDRSHALLPEGGRVGLILPASAFQAARRVARYADRWSLRQDMLPKSIYPRLRYPLCFALFSKDRRRTLVGFALYREAAAIQDFEARYRALLDQGPAVAGSVWRRAVEMALRELGGEADLPAIYQAIEGRRPTQNVHWRDKIRQVCQLHFRRVDRGRYALPQPALVH